jgi:hypothetical protein
MAAYLTLLKNTIMGFVKVSVLKANANAGRPIAHKDRIVVFDWEDVDISQMPNRGQDGVTISGNIEMKPGKYAIEIYATPKTVKASCKSSGDPDKKGFIHSLEFEHPGDEIAYASFAENWLNVNCGAIVQKWDGSQKRLFGSPGCPMQFQHEGKNDSEAVTNMVKFESFYPDSIIAHYEGAIPTLYSETSGSGA